MSVKLTEELKLKNLGVGLRKKLALGWKMEIDMIKSNAMEIKTRFFKPSFNTAVTMMRGSFAMVVKLAKNEPCIAPPNKTKATEYRQEFGKTPESTGGIPEEIKQRSDDEITSKDENDIGNLDRDVERNGDIRTLSAKAKNRAGRRVSADAVSYTHLTLPTKRIV